MFVICHIIVNDTLHLNQLLEEAEKSNPRLLEVLLLYMLENNKLNQLKRNKHDYPSTFKLLNEHMESLKSESYKRDQESPFNKVYNSYKVKRDYQKNRLSFKIKLIEKIIQIKKDKEISNYQIYTKLNLNPGNVNYALKHMDPLKLSETNLKEIIKHLESM